MSSIDALMEVPVLADVTRSKKAISLTALIDVVFILLMFFMLTSTFIKWHKVQLNTASSGNELLTPTNVESKTQLVILRESGEFSLLTSKRVNNKHEQRFTELSLLSEKLDPENTTVIIPEAQISVQTIMTSLTHLEAAGVLNVTLGNVLSAQKEQ